MNFKRQLDCMDYSLTLDIETFLKIMQLDNYACVTDSMEGPHIFVNTLSEILTEIEGIYSVRYSVEKGPHIFMGIDPDRDTENLWEEIYAAINSYIEEANNEENYEYE
jgi:hypothetical protein